MKHTQGSFLTGYVTVRVEGNFPELFFQRCAEEGMTVWNVKKKSGTVCEGNVRLSDLGLVKKVRRKTGHRLTFINKKGTPFLIKHFTQRKPVFFAFILTVLFVFLISNVLWEVKVTGVPMELEEKIVDQLDDYGVQPGAWIQSLDSPKEIQQSLIDDIPELLWVGVDQKGTTFFLEGVEKIVVKEEEADEPRNLVAAKKGVIQNMYVSKGVPQVAVHDYVQPGDLLVSGVLGENEEADDEEREEAEQPLEYVAAEGEVIANTWYEVTVNAPLLVNEEVLTGNQKQKYFIQLGNFQIPVWGFRNPEFQDQHIETNKTPIRFFKWELPIEFGQTTIHEKIYEETERTKEEAIHAGIEQAKEELKLTLGPEAEILSEKLLHETTENGKVILDLYISARENIASEERLNERYSQGD
jgi:similar to stage IV sporulation protein